MGRPGGLRETVRLRSDDGGNLWLSFADPADPAARGRAAPAATSRRGATTPRRRPLPAILRLPAGRRGAAPRIVDTPTGAPVWSRCNEQRRHSSFTTARHDRLRILDPRDAGPAGTKQRSRPLLFCWPDRSAAPARLERTTPMFVVMSVTATEAEIIGVKSHILAEGMTPHEHSGAERRVIAVVGEVGPRRQELHEPPVAACPGVETVTPISRPFKLTSREFHPEDTVIRVLDAVVGDGGLTDHGRSVLRREPRAGPRDGRGGQARPARRSSAAARSSRGRARTRSRAWASRRSATWPRRASGPACRSSPRSWRRTSSTSSPSTPTSSRSAHGTCRTTRCSMPAVGRSGR